MRPVCLIGVFFLFCSTITLAQSGAEAVPLWNEEQQNASLVKQFDSLKQLTESPTNDKRLLARALSTLGNVYQIRKEYTTAIDYYLRAIDISETYGPFIGEDDYYPAALNLYFYLGDYPNAMILCFRGLKNAEKDKLPTMIARYNNLIGYIYCKQGNLAASQKHYEQYIIMATKINDSLMLAHAYSEASEVPMCQMNYPAALSMLHNANEICRALAESSKRPFRSNIGRGVETLQVNILYKIGKAYKLAEKFSTALRYAREAISYTKKLTCNKYDVAGYYINTGDIYRELNDPANALSYLRQGLIISQDIRHRENIRDAYDQLSRTYALQHKYDSAYFYNRLFTSLKDSIVNDQTRQKIANTQAHYDLEKKEKQIAKQRLTGNIIIGAIIAFLVPLILLYNHYRLRQKNKYQQQLNRQQQEMFKTLINIQDKERKRIAQDIHDSLGSVLSAAKLKLSCLETADGILTPQQQGEYRATILLMDEAVTELRNISHNIMPAVLSKLGLPAALQNLFGNMSSRGALQFHFTTHGWDGRLREEMEISIYRIILELINNVVKHARATEVTVQLIRYPDRINIMVEDNGIGFDHNSASLKGGIGLNNISSRVQYLAGTMDIDSGLHNGATVTIDIPYLPELK